MLNTIITTYRPEYREAVFRIAADTAYFGDPVEAYLDDRSLYCGIFYRCYTDIDNQHNWVAIADCEVIGYLMSSIDTAAQQRLLAAKILPGAPEKRRCSGCAPAYSKPQPGCLQVVHEPGF